MNTVPATSNIFDPMVSLATALHAQDGVYALLLGSGVSTGAGIPTGWGVTTELVRQAAAASCESPGDNFDPELWWTEHGDGKPLGYSSLLGALAKTPAARRSLLAGFFEPSDEDREDGLKVAGPAHHAIAALVKRGAIKVIITTNFDRLLEQALEGVGIMPQVIATPAAVAGMEPLVHAGCTVMKLHGDYASLDQLNTVEELSTYSEAMGGLLERVLDEYGLVVSGWSGDWDHALVAALEGTRSRRYPLYWASYGEVGVAASRLLAQHHATVIKGVTAEGFFPDILTRLDALDSLTTSPLSLAMAISQLKRALPDPVRHLQVADLIEAQIAPIRDRLTTRSGAGFDVAPAALEEAHEVLVRTTLPLLRVLAHGVYMDRDQQHTDLWVRTIQQLMRARRTPTGTFQKWADNLAHMPGLLALRVAVIVAIEAKHENVAVRLLREPSWRDPRGTGEWSAADGLHDYLVLDHDIINSFPRWNGTKWIHARSRYIRDTLRPVLLPLLGDEETYIRAFNRAEYRTALAQYLSTDGRRIGVAPGEFIGERQWDREGGLASEAEFRETADREAWGWGAADGEGGLIGDSITAMTEELKRSRRWG